jgi:hypothetical protein
MLTSGCLAALLLLGPASQAVQAEPARWITLENSSRERVGDSDTSPALRRIDELARKWGIGPQAVREIHERPRRGTYPDTQHEFMDHYLVVSYVPYDPRLSGFYSLSELGEGLEVWIDRRTGKHTVIPKVVLRRACIAAVQAGYDLTLYRRTVTQNGDVYVVTFDRATQHAILDGSFNVLMSVKTGRLARPLLRMPLPRG